VGVKVDDDVVDDDALANLSDEERCALDGADGRASALRTIVERAREAWPTFATSRAELGAFILRRVGVAELDPETTRAADLLLACACAQGHNEAVVAFERAFFSEVDRAHAKVRPPCALDEARQLVRHRLFVRTSTDAPSIALYRGQGDLKHFVRVTATRRLLNIATRAPDEEELEEGLALASTGGEPDPEMALVRARYAREFREAFKEGVRELEPRQRALLKYAVCDGLSVDTIGDIYEVHRATAARWVAEAKERLEGTVRRSLRARLRLDDAEVESVVRCVQSQIDLSMARVFAGEPSRR
jgi:RNA polymerase sigma-70 factor (ECF subfamily)